MKVSRRYKNTKIQWKCVFGNCACQICIKIQIVACTSLVSRQPINLNVWIVSSISFPLMPFRFLIQIDFVMHHIHIHLIRCGCVKMGYKVNKHWEKTYEHTNPQVAKSTGNRREPKKCPSNWLRKCFNQQVVSRASCFGVEISVFVLIVLITALKIHNLTVQFRAMSTLAREKYVSENNWRLNSINNRNCIANESKTKQNKNKKTTKCYHQFVV